MLDAAAHQLTIVCYNDGAAAAAAEVPQNEQEAYCPAFIA